jgi:hypothetical protein
MRRLARLGPALLALLAAGCVERTLLVRTDPPGARVWVNGRDAGTTPATVPYAHPGRFAIRIEKPGYHSIAAEVTTPTTIDAVPGPDFFAENVWPGTIRRQTVADYRLAPLSSDSYTRAELEALWRAGEAFRAKAREAIAEPGTPSPTRPAPPAGR